MFRQHQKETFEKMNPILIVGAAVSGLGLMAEILNEHGLFSDGHFSKSYNWKTGRNQTMSGINSHLLLRVWRPLFASLKCDAHAQTRLPTHKQRHSFTEDEAKSLRSQIHSILDDWFYDSRLWKAGPVFINSTKITLVWPLWNKAFPDAKWILMQRESSEIIKACETASVMKRNTLAGYDWQHWLDQHEECFQEMLDPENGLDIREIQFEKIIKKDFDELHSAFKWLNLELSEKKVKNVL